MGIVEQGTAKGRRRGAGLVGAAAVVAALTGVQDAARAGEGSSGGLAPTLSGFTSAPHSERSIRVRARGAGVRFRAPATTTIAGVHTYWRKPTAGCRATLHEDARRRRGPVLATAALPDGKTGWVEAALDAPLVEGHLYHLLLTCGRSSSARLGYVRDVDARAARSGAWRLEELRHGRLRLRARPASPLFALAFTDGRWWGQPYRALRGRPMIHVCRTNEVSAVLVPRRPIVVQDVRLHHHGVGPTFTLSAGDGTPVLESRRDGRGAGTARPAAPATLAAGRPYTLRLGTRGRKGCFRQRALVTDLPLGPSLGGLDVVGLRMSSDGGRTWRETPPVSFAVTLVGTDAPLAGCGNGKLDSAEQCDGRHDDACPGQCTNTCTCPALPAPPPTCGDGDVDKGEQCDGIADGACPGRCTAACTCAANVLPNRAYRSIYPSGYLGHYDDATIPVWPKQFGLMLGEANAQGPLVGPARKLASEHGNTDARFIFYLSLTDMDARCACFDQGFYDSFRGDHPNWILKDANGGSVSTNNGIGRVFATDIGNLAYVDAWADWALAAADRWGWDGTFADNIFRGEFGGWSAPPINPRTGNRYTTADYRADILQAVRHLRARFDARGKFIVGNHTQAWQPDTFADPITKAEITALGGVEIEDCLYDWNGDVYPEASWIAQLTYLDFANKNAVRTVCSGSAIGDPGRRSYVLASYLLTKEGLSSVSELNTLSDWWSGLETDLGAPLGGFSCLDPGAGFARTDDCPSRGKVYARAWERGLVLVNPSDSNTFTVPLDRELLSGGTRVRSVALGPHSGAVLRQP